QQSKSSPGIGPEVGMLVVGTIEALGRSIALSVEVFLHRGFGARYVNCGFLGIIVLFFFPAWFQHQDPLFVWAYMVAYGVLWAIAGISALKRRWRGKDNV